MEGERPEWYRFDKRIKLFYEKYERWFIPGLLIAGFIVDIITFRTLDIQTTLLILGIHAVISGFAIIFIQLYDSREEVQGRGWRFLRLATALLAQFSLGALLSSSLVFYWFSGAFSVSWPLIAVIVGVMVSNEVFRQFYLKPVVQISLYAFVLLSYFSLLFPFVFNSVGPLTYVAGCAISTVLVLLIVSALSHLAQNIRDRHFGITSGVITVGALMTVLYFMNVIPPLPLSLREAGIYHQVVSEGQQYELVGEEENFFQRLWPGQTIHAAPGQTLYAYTAIFAPTQVQTRVIHEWQRFDPTTRQWIVKSRVPFDIRGGRQEGYRAYTLTNTTQPGKWRVSVETERGQVIGRVTFSVVAPE